jgi:hypothetical protein
MSRNVDVGQRAAAIIQIQFGYGEICGDMYWQRAKENRREIVIIGHAIMVHQVCGRQ